MIFKVYFLSLWMLFYLPHTSLSCKVWSGLQELSSLGAEGSSPDIAINDVGQIAAVWIENSTCKAASMTVGTSWSAPVTLRYLTGAASFPAIRINNEGEAIASWKEMLTGTSTGFFTSALLFGYGWGEIIPIATGNTYNQAFISISETGRINAFISSFKVSSEMQVYQSLFGGAWSPPISLTPSSSSTQIDITQKNMQDAGLIGIIWTSNTGTPPKRIVYAALLSKDEGLMATSTISGMQLSASGQDAESPHLAVNKKKRALAIWSRSNGTHTIIQTTEKWPSGSWSTPEDLSQPGANATTPQIAMNASGLAIAVWVRSDGTTTRIQAAKKEFGSAWSTPVYLSSAGGDATNPQIALSDSGEAFAVWEKANGTHTIIQASTYSASSWSNPIDLSSAGQNAHNPQVAINSKGESVAIWERFDGLTSRIQAITAFAPEPPSSVRLVSKLMTGVQENYYRITLRWRKSTDTAAAYKIYRNGTLIEQKGAETLSYQDFIRASDLPVTYAVSALSAQGQESSQVLVSLP